MDHSKLWAIVGEQSNFWLIDVKAAT